MKEILFGTTNEAKIKQIGGVLALRGVEVMGIAKEEILPDIVESGSSALENALIKAIAYSDWFGVPVFSMDNALYLDGLKPEEQPGVNVRRFNGISERASDHELIDYYSSMISKLGGRVNGYWEYGICVASPDGRIWQTVIQTPRIFVSEPSNSVKIGYPLESIQVDPDSGRYYSEMSQEENNLFWQDKIGGPILEFIESIEL